VTGEEDVPPPGTQVLPPEDPKVDGSGGGDDDSPDPLDDGDATIWPDDKDGRDPEGGEYPGYPDVDPSECIYGEPLGPATARDILRFRGVLSANRTTPSATIDRDHPDGGDEKNLRILPCFRVLRDPMLGIHQRPGRNDVVTLTDGKSENPVRIKGRVRWAYWGGDWMALEDFTEQAIQPIEAEGDLQDLHLMDFRGKPRILKVPTGELPDELPTEMEFGKSTINNSSVVTAFLDELVIWRHPTQVLGQLVNTNSSTSAGIDADATDIYIGAPYTPMNWEGIAGFHPDVGLLDLEGELILWRGSHREDDSTIVLERCVRGVLGTTPRYHAYGSYGKFVPDLPVSCLSGQTNRDAASIPLLRAKDWPREGCVRIVGESSVELVEFTARTDQELILPGALDADPKVRDRGLLRGRFGTDAVDHDDGAPVFWQPIRYWDRYTARRTDDGQSFGGVHEHPESSYLELGKRVRSGYWQRISWDENLTGATSTDVGGGPPRRGGDRSGGRGDAEGFLDLVFVARLSSAVPWDSERVVDLRKSAGIAYTRPSSPAGGHLADSLYVFDDKDEPNRLGIESDTMEMRAYFVYRPGAYRAIDATGQRGEYDDVVFENTWKMTPALKSVTVEYTNRTTTRYHGER
jgi:hypothetical protein